MLMMHESGILIILYLVLHERRYLELLVRRCDWVEGLLSRNVHVILTDFFLLPHLPAAIMVKTQANH